MEKIQLTNEEVEYLSAFVKTGKKSAREITHAHILLLVNEERIENVKVLCIKTKLVRH